MIHVVGLGPADEGHLSVAARERLQSGVPVVLRTEHHPTVGYLRREGIPFSTCDDLYEALEDFESVYEAIVTRVLELARRSDLVYAVPGDPMVGEETVRRLLPRARSQDIPVTITGSMSFLEPVLRACGAHLDRSLLIVDALSLGDTPLPPDTPLLFYQVYDRETASRVKLKLMETHPDEHQVTLVRHAGDAVREEVERLPLFRLDHAVVDHLTAVWVPEVPLEQRHATFADLVEVMRRLRAPDGCPWDRAQTHATLRRWLIEECYEAVEAIDRADPDGLCEELGDVLLQIVFHAQLGAEKGEFDIQDVIQRVVEKLIRRHPHVFGAATAEDPSAVERNWEAIKNAEKHERTSIMDGLPTALPALHRAAEIGRRAAAVGFEWKQIEDVLDKVDEELAELRESIRAGNQDAIRHEVGDLLFAITNVARWVSVDPEEALREMLARFLTRFRAIEAAAKEAGRDLRSFTLEEMDAIWNEAKARSG